MTGSSDERRGSRRKKSARLATLIGLVLAVAASATVVGAAGTVTRQTVRPVDVHNTKSFWTRAAKPVATPGRTVAVHAARFRSLTLDTAALRLRSRARAGREHACAPRRARSSSRSRPRTASSSCSRSTSRR